MTQLLVTKISICIKNWGKRLWIGTSTFEINNMIVSSKVTWRQICRIIIKMKFYSCCKWKMLWQVGKLYFLFKTDFPYIQFFSLTIQLIFILIHNVMLFFFFFLVVYLDSGEEVVEGEEAGKTLTCCQSTYSKIITVTLLTSLILFMYDGLQVSQSNFFFYLSRKSWNTFIFWNFFFF